jgi:predicted nucleic acid-binding protein
MTFWDSSALLPLVVAEPSTPAILALARGGKDIVIWWLTPVECASGLRRRRRAGELTPTALAKASAVLDKLIDGSLMVEPTDEVPLEALRLVAEHPLRAGDAVQLAAAVVWAGGPGRAAGKGFVCLDHDLRAAAAAEGFDLLPHRV